MSPPEKPLYEDKFFRIGTWLHSGLVQLATGLLFAMLAIVYLHWTIGLIILAVALVVSLASYIVLKK